LPELLRVALEEKLRIALEPALERLATGLARLEQELAGERERTAATLAKMVAAEVADAIDKFPPAPAGPKGDPGHDAVFMPPGRWKAGRLVEAGELVTHRNAVWQALHDSDAEPGTPMSSYALVWDGIVSAELERDDRGYLRHLTTWASGHVERSTVLGRLPQDAGVYDQERQYETHDLVSHGGSLWIARAPSRGAKPGTDEGGRYWRLAVKCGKDGKPGERGEKGERGERGPKASKYPGLDATGGPR
jgi:hypothetical protein